MPSASTASVTPRTGRGERRTGGAGAGEILGEAGASSGHRGIEGRRLAGHCKRGRRIGQPDPGLDGARQVACLVLEDRCIPRQSVPSRTSSPRRTRLEGRRRLLQGARAPEGVADGAPGPRRRAGGRDHLAGVRDPVGVEGAPQPLEYFEVAPEHLRHRAPCRPDAVLTGERPASMQAPRIASASVWLPRPALRRRTTRGWRLPSPAWKTFPTRGRIVPGKVGDPSQHLGKLRPRHGAIWT